MGKLGLVVLSAILIEAVVEWVKDLVRAEVRWPKLVALGVSVPVLFLLELDIFSLVGIEQKIPFLGTVLLAFVASRGAGYAHEFLDRVMSWKKG